MGVEGTMEYISELLKMRRKKKKKPMQTVALRVTRIDCEGCERKIKHILSGVKGISCTYYIQRSLSRPPLLIYQIIIIQWLVICHVENHTSGSIY